MTTKIPENLRFTHNHEWAELEGERIVIGITEFAQSALGDIVFIELPAVGTELEVHQFFGVLKSTKSINELFIPIAGTIIEINSDLTAEPDKCNISPYEEGWMVKIKPYNLKEFEKLLTPRQYKDHLNTI